VAKILSGDAVSAVNVYASDKPSEWNFSEREGSESVGEADLLLLTAGKRSACLRIAAQDGLRVQELPAGQTILLACAHTSLHYGGADLTIRRMGANRLCKLLAFMDKVDSIRTSGLGDTPLVVMPFDPDCLDRERGLEYWFIPQMLQGGADIQLLAGFLRRLESYWLVRFLLADSSRLKNVSSLGSEYGLSYSHFRRVCKTVLGNSVKAELKDWRAARSLLEAIEGADSMTEVAIRNGYASSSHFSTEIKKLFGRSPRSMTALRH
jgi:AraC-like DNA-binding protein